MKETLEEYIKEVTKNFGDEMSIKFTSGGIKLGAKWQAEKMITIEAYDQTMCAPVDIKTDNRKISELSVSEFVGVMMKVMGGGVERDF